MSKIFSSLHISLRTTPFYGRTLVVLSFFFLVVKQLFIFLAYGEAFQELTLSATLVHYFGFFVSDFLVCIVLLAIVGVNMLFKKTRIKIINNSILSAIFLVFVLDIFTMYFFQSRISIIDMGQFIDPSLGNFAGMIISIIVVLGVLSSIAFLFVQSQNFQKNQKTFFAFYVVLFTIACFGFATYSPQGFAALPKNIISLNIGAVTEDKQEATRSTSSTNYQSFFKDIKGSNKHPNIIIVFAESLSPIDSLMIGGVNNRLPYFDIIQKQGLTFTNFITNGGTSDTAHIGLLLGVEPLKLMGRQISSYYGYKTATETLPSFFAKQGYNPIFISAAGLDFLNQRSFLTGVGFTTIVGEESFVNKKKYTFDSAPDHDLYNKTLETIKTQTGPYLAVLQTISFHKPYDTPYGKTEEDALRYSDKTLFYFYLQLKKAKFFDNGLLVIVSDHRKMTPLEPKEKDALGEFWYVRGLATIVGTGITPGSVNPNIIQHTDIFYGLKKLVSTSTVTVSKIYNDIFSLTKRRTRGLSSSRYYNNTYTIVSGLSGSKGKTFDTISEIISTDPLVYKYLSSYMSFQYGSGSQSSGNNDMVIIAHRGSPLQTTENSLSGFILAKKNGADGIEFDVSYTKDNQNIVLHGDTTYSTICGNNIKIRTHTFEWLEKNCPLTNGEPILTLEEMLKGVDGLFNYYFVEIKVSDPQYAEQQTIEAIKTVQKLGMQDRIIFTSYDKTATYVLGSYKNITAGRDTFNIEELTTLPNMNHQYYLMPKHLITSTMAQEVHDIGKKLVVYTIDTTGEVANLYHQGVRMIMTDDVPLIKKWADSNLNK